MRAPPPVEFSSALGRRGRAALSLLVGAAVAVPLAWALPYAAAVQAGTASAVLVQAGVALSAVALAAGAFWHVRRLADVGERTLRWDGQDWILRGQDGARDQRGEAALMLDLGPWMLVRFRPAADGGSRAVSWLPLTLADDAARWAALRGALWNWRAGRGDARP